MGPDFSGYATKHNLKCSDGRTIRPGAFKHQDKMKVPLVWQHQHDTPDNVLGHAFLTYREEGVWTDAYFNESPSALNAKESVRHGDVNSLSIYANKLVQRGGDVLHGDIKEVSLVLSGANPGAFIEHVYLKHSDGTDEVVDDAAVIYTGLSLEHSDDNREGSEENLAHEEGETAVADSTTVKDVFDSMTEEQKNVVYFMIGSALEEAGVDDDDLAQSDTYDDEEDSVMTRNVFEQDDNTLNHSGMSIQKRPTLTHSQLEEIVTDAKKLGSFRDSFLAHAVDYGIENIDFLFPDPKNLSNAPELISRRMEWVSQVINGVKKSPFSRIKTMSADITHDEARARGYIKGKLKKEEWFALAKRVTTPQTIYKKQKLDRDDIIDITDLDVVAWLKAEMRIMLDEELARAILVGDGREIDDEDKIQPTNIRPIAHEDEFYAHKVVIPANVTGDALVEAVIRNRKFYRGSGNPTFFTTEDLLTDLLLTKDKMGRRQFENQGVLEAQLRVSSIVPVEVLEGQSTDDGAILGIMVNLADYTLGADRGGAISMFDDFDIDYNQYKYLMETRCSGALTKFKSALVLTRATGATMVTPVVPAFDPATGTITIPVVSGVVYSIDGTPVTGSRVITKMTEVVASPEENYYFPQNYDNDWVFEPTGG